MGLTAVTANDAQKIYSFNASGNYIPAGGVWGLDPFHAHRERGCSGPRLINL